MWPKGWGCLMRTVAECQERAEECRRLAILVADRRDWGHFEEIAQTWEMLLSYQQERSRWQTIALADRFRNVLFLSDIAPKKLAEADNSERRPEALALSQAESIATKKRLAGHCADAMLVWSD
jgi:hypothetical protein